MTRQGRKVFAAERDSTVQAIPPPNAILATVSRRAAMIYCDFSSYPVAEVVTFGLARSGQKDATHLRCVTIL